MPSVTAVIRTLTFLPTSFAASATMHVDAVELRDARARVVQAELAELHLELLPDVDRQLGRDLLERALVEHPEVVEVHVLLADEEEAALGRLLELAQPLASGADDQRGDRALTSTLNAFEREPGVTSARSRRSMSTAAVCSETTMPSPPQVGHFLVITSRGPSVTFWRVISTRPSGEISTTYVFVRSRSSSVAQRLLDLLPGSSGSPCR